MISLSLVTSLVAVWLVDRDRLGRGEIGHVDRLGLGDRLWIGLVLGDRLWI